MSIISSLLFILFVTLPQLAPAYIDPGTGASFVGSMAPILTGLGAAFVALLLRIFWNPIKRLFGKDDDEEEYE